MSNFSSCDTITTVFLDANTTLTVTPAHLVTAQNSMRAWSGNTTTFTTSSTTTAVEGGGEDEERADRGGRGR
jgi:hypothetical protein